MKFYLLAFLTLYTCTFWSLDEQKLDSLYSELDNHPVGTELIETYIEIAKIHEAAEANDSVLKYADLADSLSVKANYHKGIAAALMLRADYYSSNRKYESALVELKKALQIRQEHNLGPEAIGNAHVALGNTYQRKGMIVEGLAEYQNATDVFLENDMLIESTIPMMNQGNMYLNLDDTAKARHYYFEAKRISDELGELGHSYGNILNGIGIYYLQTSQFDSMMVYYKKALKIFEAKDYKTGIANGHNNIAIAYYYLEQPEKALEHFQKALRVRQLLKDRIGEAQSLNNIGLYYEGFEDYESALLYFQKSLTLADEIEAKSEMFDAVQALYETYEKINDFENAFFYRDSMYILKQLISQENHMRSVEDLEAKYNAKNKDKEIVQLNELRTIDAALSDEKHFANNLIIGGVSIVALVLACLGVVLLLGNKRKKAVNVTLTNQKSEIEEQKDQLEQINTDVQDSIKYAEQIQQAILPENHDLAQLGDYFMLFKPRDIVSGDFYWYFKRGDDQFVAVADCTGHGVPGAFVSMLCHNAISQVIIEQGNSDPGEILSMVNKEVLKKLKKKGDKFQISDGMDILLCKYNKPKSSFKFSGAFNSLLMLNRGVIVEHKVDKVAIGGSTSFDFEFQTQDLTYSSGDTVYLRTDGYQDQFGGKKGKKFLKKNLNAILQNFDNVEMSEQQEILIKALADWQQDYRQVDDITLMGLRLA